MLPKKLRIKISHFNENSQPAVKKHFRNYLIITKRNDNTDTRFVILTPKSISKKTTERNRTKRIIERLIMDNKEKAERGKDTLIIPKTIIGPGNRTDMEEEFLRIIKNEIR